MFTVQADEEIEMVIPETTLNETLKPVKKKNTALKIILSIISCLFVAFLVLSYFVYDAYSSAKTKCESVSKAIVNMQKIPNNSEDSSWLENKIYEEYFKEKNEKDVVDLVKRNFYINGSSNLVNKESIEKIKAVKKVCNDFGLDKVKYADVYLYIETALGLEKYVKYNTLYKHLIETLPMLSEEVYFSPYGGMNSVITTFSLIAIRMEKVLTSVTVDMSDSETRRYIAVVLEISESVLECLEAAQVNNIDKVQQKIVDYSTLLLETTKFSKEAQDLNEGTLAILLQLTEIEARINKI